ncbi:hypothetical protein R1flu_014645 [Riccia fluitans]|uniref:Ribosomal protein L2 n=1 Tax=Riccia fluitans TaxID=41844 RepID=A0ABD1YGP0_9MARC
MSNYYATRVGSYAWKHAETSDRSGGRVFLLQESPEREDHRLPDNSSFTAIPAGTGGPPGECGASLLYFGGRGRRSRRT